MVIQPIINIAEICSQKGIKNVVLSPGSRCAHLAIAFVRHTDIKTYTISDERSAAFMALGMAQRSGEPVALLCTSGTAALNYYPAIAEAFYQNIPLVVFTADRPDEWVDQKDGQTIRQQNLYSNHIKKSYHLPVDYSHNDAIWYSERAINEAINIANSESKGPVHINVPIREPFYPSKDELLAFDKTVRVIKQFPQTHSISQDALKYFEKIFNASNRILILAGQQNYSSHFSELVENFAKKYHLPVVGDILSNLNFDHRINHVDMTLFNASLYHDLRPDLLISFGNSVLSKNLKNFLRKNTPAEHIHIQIGDEIADYLQSIHTIINSSATSFFEQISNLDLESKSDLYFRKWKSTELGFEERLEDHFKSSPFSEFEAIDSIIRNLPTDSILHLANSMSVRYANYLKIGKEDIEIYSNRGTSGIDGCTSTAVGMALSTRKQVTLITGDMAFFYDRNALWNNYFPQNLRIIVLNNHAGGIFRIIDGSSSQPELEEYFETRQMLSIENTVKDLDVLYMKIEDKGSLMALTSLVVSKQVMKAQIIEIITNTEINTRVLKGFSGNFKK